MRYMGLNKEARDGLCCNRTNEKVRTGDTMPFRPHDDYLLITPVDHSQSLEILSY